MVSAVILAYNRCSEVLITIDKLKTLQLPFDFEIIVVDNASPDDTSKQVQVTHPDVTLITNKTNSGISGWNSGFSIAKHNYFLVLDDDSHIEDGLEEVIQFMEANPGVGIAALNIIGGTYQTDDATEWRDKEDSIGFIGCGAVIKRDVYEKIGGFAEWLYLYTHEYEYGLRCINAGYRIVFFKNSRVIHRTSKLNRTNKRLRTFSSRNEFAIVYKYFKSNRWKYILRILVNNLKLIKSEGLVAGSYVIDGFIKFLKMRSELAYTPVTKEVQNFFIKNFRSVHPVIKPGKN